MKSLTRRRSESSISNRHFCSAYIQNCQFKFQINTTEKCVTISDLRSATRYTIYAIARSAFGASVPSVRSIATTNPHVISNNESLPDSNRKKNCLRQFLFERPKQNHCNVPWWHRWFQNAARQMALTLIAPRKCARSTKIHLLLQRFQLQPPADKSGPR